MRRLGERRADRLQIGFQPGVGAGAGLVERHDRALESPAGRLAGRGALRTTLPAVERLWTPWRRAFVESAGGAGPAPACFLCDIASADPARDREHLLIHRGERAIALLNRYPYNNGHLLIAPREHTGDYARLEPTAASALTALTQRAVAALERAYRPDAFNVGMNLGRAAGAGLPDHLHVHVVPRWAGDTNFMPVVGNTKVLPETLDQTYERLLPLFAQDS